MNPKLTPLAALIIGLGVSSAVMGQAQNPGTSASSATDAQTTADTNQTSKPEESTTPTVIDFSEDRGLPVYLGSIRVYPKIVASFGSDSNVFQESTGKTSVNYWQLAPSVFADYESRGQRYEFAYKGSIRDYQSTGANANTDSHQLTLAGDNVFTVRHGLGWRLGHVLAEEDFESDLTRSAGKPVQYRASSADFTYRFGAPGARGRLEFDYGVSDKRYLNERITTSEFDTKVAQYGARFLARVAAQTFAFVELKNINTEYNEAVLKRDNDQKSASLGLTWRATAKTTGVLKLARVDRDYKDTDRKDLKSNTWDIVVNWAPVTYSKFVLTVGRGIGDSSDTTFGDSILQDRIDLRWSHSWKSFLRSTVAWNRVVADYSGGEEQRKDTTDKFLLGLYYDFPRNYTIGLEIQPSERSSATTSPSEDFNFKRRQTMAVFQAKF